MPVSAQVLPDWAPEAIDGPDVDCRVMVIDDNRDAAITMAMLVEELGGDCRTASDAEGGLRDMLTYRPYLVLLDIDMPGIDGYETCRRIRRDFGDEVAVVALTGFGQDQDKVRAATAGFNAHLTKPADPAALVDLLGKCSAAKGLGERRRS